MSEYLINELQKNFEQLKKVAELDKKLEGEDKITLNWLICGFSESLKKANQKDEKISRAIEYINKYIQEWDCDDEVVNDMKELLKVLERADK